MTNYKNMRTDKKLIEALKEAARARVAVGKDKEMRSYRRMTLATANIPNLKEVLLNAEIKKKDKR